MKKGRIMSKTAVLFRSKYGATKEYSLQLGRSIQAEVVENYGLTPELVKDFDVLILAGGVYAGKINGLDFLKRNYPELQGKRIAVLAIGAAPDSDENTESLYKGNLKGKLENIPLFYARGAFDKDSLSSMDKLLFSMVKKAAEKEKPEKRTPLETVILETEEAVSWVDFSSLDSLIDFARQGM
ncbi:MAG: flavodoxin [Spirochaetes bacterium]|uniref:Flavodoxin n=1 Tax=Candidatus Ornithospirochaeta stercoripullorum TaxID=2840899 RepID=A0A9D9E066_9SPIO|nr:flavodoxin [Candidatus Ornithospirochaeta stercoripullorum]